MSFMSTKEKIKKEIDKLPNALLDKVSIYIDSLKSIETKKKSKRTFHLKGKFDNVNVREKAYE